MGNLKLLVYMWGHLKPPIERVGKIKNTSVSVGTLKPLVYVCMWKLKTPSEFVGALKTPSVSVRTLKTPCISVGTLKPLVYHWGHLKPLV